MKAEIKDGNLVITIPLQEPTASASGKTLVVASTHGNVKAGVQVQGQDVMLGLNAYIKR
jgi:hypothetical protein